MRLALLGALIVVSSAPAPAAEDVAMFDRANLIAWCIVPFDAKRRGPEERAAMVERLRLGGIAYDWRDEHVPTFAEEILAYQRHHLEFFAFWGLHDAAFALFAKHGLHPQIWLMFGGGDGATQEESVRQAAESLLGAVERTRQAGCQLALYNHGGWAGEPDNLVAVCERLRREHQADHVGIVYNLHHGHGHIDDFAEALARMRPYLLCLNLNGMEPGAGEGGRKILPLGQGSSDLALLRIIRDSGYRGRIGVIGHTMNDAEDQLRDNLDGLDWLVPQLRGEAAGPKPVPRTLKP